LYFVIKGLLNPDAGKRFSIADALSSRHYYKTDLRRFWPSPQDAKSIFDELKTAAAKVVLQKSIKAGRSQQPQYVVEKNVYEATPKAGTYESTPVNIDKPGQYASSPTEVDKDLEARK